MDDPFLTNLEYAIAECNAKAEDIFNALEVISKNFTIPKLTFPTTPKESIVDTSSSETAPIIDYMLFSQSILNDHNNSVQRKELFTKCWDLVRCFPIDFHPTYKLIKTINQIDESIIISYKTKTYKLLIYLTLNGIGVITYKDGEEIHHSRKDELNTETSRSISTIIGIQWEMIKNEELKLLNPIPRSKETIMEEEDKAIAEWQQSFAEQGWRQRELAKSIAPKSVSLDSSGAIMKNMEFILSHNKGDIVLNQLADRYTEFASLLPAYLEPEFNFDKDIF
jgi:hypothetical protein